MQRLSVGIAEVLGVATDASEGAIREAFHALAKTAHPDKGGDGARFAELQSSYKALLGARALTLKEAQQATHADLVRWLTPSSRKRWAIGAPGNDGNSVVADGLTMLLDSTNGGKDGRDHARRVSAAEKTLLVQLRTSSNAADAARVEEWLLARATNRPTHPAFPADDEPERQRKKVKDVLAGIEWASAAEARALTTEVIDCDPTNSAQLTELPWEVWSRIFVGPAVLGAI